MAKILIVPDVHGSHEWEVAKEKISEVDYVVFLGDYVDSWNNKHPDQEENVKAIFDFKRKNPDKVKLLLGNHDWSYFSGSREGSNCSGHQFNMAALYRALFISNKDIIDLAFECDGWVFSHAGFSKTAVKLMCDVMHNIYTKYPKAEKTAFDSKEEADAYFAELYKNVKEWDPKEYSIDFLNKCWHERTHFPGTTNFSSSFDEKLDWDGYFSGSGDEKTQFCLWIRPHSLLEDAYYPMQVVGHTEYCFGNYTVWKKNENIVVICDSRNHRVYDIFDTQKLPVEPITELEWNRRTKQLDKKLNNIKSTFGMIESETGERISDSDKRLKLVEEFGDIGNEYFDLFFKS